MIYPRKPPLEKLCPRHNTPSPDQVVSVTGEQGLTISTPCQADTLWLSALLSNGLELWLQLINLALLLQIEDDDAAGGGSAEPVSVGGEDKGVDLITGSQGVEVLRLVQVPQHGSSILSTRSAERPIGRDSNRVDVTGVSNVVGLETAAGELPNLDQLVPTRADNDRVLRVWAESDAGNPLRVTLLSDGELAVAESVPELDGSVSRSRDNLSVVCREGNRENIIGVANESTGGGTGGELPETEGLVPGCRESVCTVRRDDAVRDDVAVAVEGSLWVAV